MSQKENGLGNAASAYLRSARNQPVAWNEWGPEAFEKARQQNKPVLLDIGAVWCHWCHVMDRESYENPDTAHVINEFFIAIKVDRDERPDVDTRYQSAVAAISGQGGWPLTAFLTPEGKPYFGGTYFPAEERYGRPGFQRVLITMADAFANKRDEVEESAGSVMEAIVQSETFSGHAGNPGAELLGKLIDSAIAQFDERNGGFGAQPKFPHAGALDLLLDAANRRGPQADAARHVAATTLHKMAAGGIHDQLAGGFHRYSVDEKWVVPHFEKMAYDNSELLKVYAHAFQNTGDSEFATVAKDILRWMDEWLSDRDLGGFYASQDADATLSNDGDYFTWTLAEVQAVLSEDDFNLAEQHFNLREIGDMHHNPQKNVLHLRAGASVEPAAVERIKETLYAARLQRKMPFIDKTIYTGWNGMCIAAYLQVGRALDLQTPIDFALKSLDRLLEAVWNPAIGLAHVVAYADGIEGKRIAGVLEDYAFVANAALDAWEATADMKYFIAAKDIADDMLTKFCDIDPATGAGSGFFDTEQGIPTLGALSAQRKPLQDSPTPAGNGVASMLLLRLHALTSHELYRTRAQETLETFAGIVEHFGLYVASYGLALRLAVEAPVQVCIIGDDAKANELAATARASYAVNKSVVRLRRSQLGSLPPALAETLPHLDATFGSVAVLCKGNTCLPAIASVEALHAELTSV
jgi:uncharacterized protein YyaL (SSP411 family)